MEKKKKEKTTDILNMLRARKEKDGKLSKFGEWLLEDENVKYVMR